MSHRDIRPLVRMTIADAHDFRHRRVKVHPVR